MYQYWLLISLFFLVGGCQNVEVVITINGLTSDITSLRLGVIKDGRVLAVTPTELSPVRSQIVAEFAGAGTLALTVTGLDEGNCQVSQKSTVFNLDSSRVKPIFVEVTLEPLASRLCTLTIQSVGDGSVDVSPKRPECRSGQCSYDFTGDTTVSFDAHPGPSAYTAEWFSDEPMCSGRAPCRVNASRSRTLRVFFIHKVCEQPGWCQTPLPAEALKTSLHGLWGSDLNDVWAVGDSGLILHYNGTGWSAVPSPVSVPLRQLWGSSASDIWAVGAGGVLIHYDGKSWQAAPESTTVTSYDLAGIWGISGREIWAVGGAGSLLHYDGSRWRRALEPADPRLQRASLSTVWGKTASDLWVVGAGATMLHFDGKDWQKDDLVPQLIAANLYAIWGTAANDVWAAGGAETRIHFDGTKWQLRIDARMQTTLNSLWGSTDGTLWSVGEQGTILEYVAPIWRAHAASGVVTTESLRTIWGTNRSNSWATGLRGVLLTYQP